MLDLSTPNSEPVDVLHRGPNISHPIGIDYYQGRLYYTDRNVKVSRLVVYDIS